MRKLSPKTEPGFDAAEAKRQAALRTIAGIVEDHMTAMGLSEAEKNVKTAELVAIVSDAVSAKLQPLAKHGEPLQIAASQA